MSKYLIDFLDTASVSDIEDYLRVNECTVISEFSHYNNVFHVASDVLPPSSSIVVSVLDDGATSLKLLTVTDVVHKTYDTVILNADHIDDWWKIYSCYTVDLSNPTVSIKTHLTDHRAYIVDSGLEVSHPEFVGRRIELLYSVVPDDFSDVSGHGTALASVINGNTCSINDVILSVVKVFDGTGSVKTSALLSAFNAIIADVLAKGETFPVVNLSWAIPRNVYIEQKIQILVDLGITVVVASGNSGIPIEDVTPAAMKDVIAVGSYGMSFEPSSFSDYSGTSATSLTAGIVNYGELDGWAPGEQIRVATLGGGYGFVAGTSIAAAVHTSVILYNLDSSVMTGFTWDIIYNTMSNMPSEIAAPWKKSRNSFFRKGLLNLSDPKYNNSPNIISTFFNEASSHEYGSPSVIKLVVRVNQSDNVRLFSAMKTASYEILTPLPDWCYIVGNYLVVSPVNNPATTSGVEATTIRYKLTQLDGSVVEVTADLVVLSESFNIHSLLADDPLIPITLMGPPCTSYTEPDCDAAPNCGIVGCIGDGKSGNPCWCQF